MALKDIFTMIKADRYTADGCEEIKKAQKAIKEETADAGLPDGSVSHRKDGDYIKKAGKWVPAPAAKGKAGGGTKADLKIINRAAKKEWERQNPEVKQQEAAEEKKKMDALAQKKLKEHEEKEREKKEAPSKKALGAFQNIAHRPNSREYIKSKSVDEIVTEMQKNGSIKTPEEISEAKRITGILKELVESTSDSEEKKPDAPAPSANQSELLAKKRQWDAEGGPANEAERAEYDKLRSQIVYKLPDEKSSFSTDVNRMKKLKEQDPREFSVQLEKLHSKYNTNKWNDLYRKISQDAAPRQLTGDCKIRIKKQTSDGTYTPQSINAPRENLEKKMTGDCKIRIRKG